MHKKLHYVVMYMLDLIRTLMYGSHYNLVKDIYGYKIQDCFLQIETI